MLRIGTYVCIASALALLIVERPGLPGWSGAALLALVLVTGPAELSNPRPAVRRAATKRLAALTVLGLALVVAGTGRSAPWDQAIRGAAGARAAIPGLAIYALAMLAAPVAAWAHLAHGARRPSPPRRARRRPLTLARLAARQRVHVRAAV